MIKIQEVIDLFTLQAEKKNIKILSFNEDFKDQKMFSDPNRIKQILLNLISNSLKYTKVGQISIIVQKESQNQFQNSNNLLRVTVKDTGIGIPDEIKPKLFEMYQTYDHDEGSNKYGTGLGLFICKSLISMLGPQGQIELNSQKDQGTEISFKLYIDLTAKSSLHLSSRISQVSLSIKKRMSDEINNEINYFQHSQQSLIQQKRLSKKSEIWRLENIKLIIEEDEELNKNCNIGKLKQKYSMNQMKRLDSISSMINIQGVDDLASFSRKNNKSKNEENLKKNPQQNLSLQVIPPQKTSFHERDNSNSLDDIANQNFRILIVDDQIFNVKALKLLLKKYENIEVYEAYDGEQAINSVIENYKDSKQIDLVFMDLNMPIQDGFETGRILIEKIKQQLISPLILIALSGNDDEADKLRCEKIGFDAFIAKPIKKSEIVSIFSNFQIMPVLRNNQNQ